MFLLDTFPVRLCSMPTDPLFLRVRSNADAIEMDRYPAGLVAGCVGAGLLAGAELFLRARLRRGMG